MSANAPSYYMPLAGASSQDLNSSIPAPRRHLGEKILPRVQALQPVRHDFYTDSVYMVFYSYTDTHFVFVYRFLVLHVCLNCHMKWFTV